VLKPKRPKLHVVHPVVHLFGNTRSNRVEGLDEFTLLNWENSTGPHPLNIATHSLKVETRVRTPLGLLIRISAGWQGIGLSVGGRGAPDNLAERPNTTGTFRSSGFLRASAQ
jgi:hypothetical protein